MRQSPSPDMISGKPQRYYLVLLDANPLVDIGNTRKIAGVVVKRKIPSAGVFAENAC
jgi:hypothetical protein